MAVFLGIVKVYIYRVFYLHQAVLRPGMSVSYYLGNGSNLDILWPSAVLDELMYAVKSPAIFLSPPWPIKRSSFNTIIDFKYISKRDAFFVM